MPRLAPLGVFLLATIVPAIARAQDYGRDWLDRVTHQMIEEDAPLAPHPFSYKASVGELYQYDSNIFLTDTDRKADSIFLTFAQARFNLAQPNFDAAADLAID